MVNIFTALSYRRIYIFTLATTNERSTENTIRYYVLQTQNALFGEPPAYHCGIYVHGPLKTPGFLLDTTTRANAYGGYLHRIGHEKLLTALLQTTFLYISGLFSDIVLFIALTTTL